MLRIYINERVERASDYKYIIEKGMYNYCAFHTQKGFEEFLERANINFDKCKPVNIIETKEKGKIEIYSLDVEIEEKSFWKLEDIPQGAKKFKGLSNGSYVDCYYIHTEKGSRIFKPNPNAKEVYKPLTLEEHIQYGKIHG